MAKANGSTNARQVAIVLQRLEKGTRERIVRLIDPSMLEIVAREMMSMGAVSTEEAQSAVQQVHGIAVNSGGRPVVGGTQAAIDMLSGVLSEDAVESMLARIAASEAGQPFEFLQDADVRQVVSMLQAEHPQTITVVLTHMRPDVTAKIFAELPSDVQRDVTRRIIKAERPHPDALSSLAEMLSKKATTMLAPRDMSTVVVGGIQPIVEIINRSDNPTEKNILDALDAFDINLADAVRDKMFVFDDIILLDERALSVVIGAIDTQVLALALRRAGAEQKDAIMRVLSSRIRTDVEELLGATGRKHLLVDVEAAQSTIVKKIRELEEAGQIVVRRSENSEDEFVD